MKSFMPIVLILISAGLFFIHISPRYHKIEELQQEQKQYQNALSSVDALTKKRDDLLTAYNNFSKDDLTRLNHIVPDKVNTVQLVTDIDSIAGRYGIAVRSVRVTDQTVDNSQVVASATTPKNPYQTTTINFSFSSTYKNLIPFLKDLESSLQMIDIKSISFQVPTTGGSGGVYEYSITLQTYWLK